MDRANTLLILFGIASLLAGCFIFAMFRVKPFGRFEMSRLYFAAGTMAVIAFMFLVSMIFYAYGPEAGTGEPPGKAIFDACVRILPPIVTLIIGFYFGAQHRATQPEDQSSAAPRVKQAPRNI